MLSSDGNAVRRPETMLVAGGRPTPPVPGTPLNVPMIPASNFRAAPGGALTGREYARDDGTPGWEALEQVLGELEGGHAVAYASGMAAVTAVLDQLAVGSRIVAPTDCYMALRTALLDGARTGRWHVEFVDISDTDAVVRALPGADLLWAESPTNPLLDVADLNALCSAARSVGAAVVVDNTLATPLLQRPLALGASMVVHSATKFIGGHSDLLMGVVIAPDVEVREHLRRRRELTGAVPGTLETFLALRGLRTMALRVDRGQRSAGELARRLHGHPAVVRVRYPGLPGDPGRLRAARQMDGFGAVLAFDVTDAATADAVCDTVRTIQPATSLGGVESTIERRAKLPGQEHVPPGLLRLSVGCEHVEDLWHDLATALPTGRGAVNEVASRIMDI